MSTPAAATSICHEIVVHAPIARAFSVFTDDFGSFKPPEHNMLSVEIAETVFEPRGGESRPRHRWQHVPLGAGARVRAAAPRRDRLGYQPAMADRDRPGQGQRG